MKPRDLFLARDLTEADAHEYLAAHGFRNPAAADELLQQLADDLPTRLALGEIAGLLIDSLTEAPDPDAAVAGFCRYVTNRFPKSSFVSYLQDDPRTLQILTHLLGASPLIGEILIRNPENLHWLHRELDCPPPDLEDYRTEADLLLAQDIDVDRRLDMLKRFQRRETLRIAGRDLLDKDTLRSTTEQLSNLADIVTGSVLRMVRDGFAASAGGRSRGSFVVIGMGKLGGRELNYDPEIDLLYLYELDDPRDDAAHEYFQMLARQVTAGLSERTVAGYLYRVDLGQQSAGGQTAVASPLERWVRHCERQVDTLEQFTLIKMRPVAGDLALGQRFLELVRPFAYRAQPDRAALAALARSAMDVRTEAAERDVRTGPGGSREIELAVQLLQLLHGGRQPDLQEANTLAVLAKLRTRGLVEAEPAESLAAAYRFLRTAEHRLQIGKETQALPAGGAALEIMARRMGLATAAELDAALDEHRRAVRDNCTCLLDGALTGS